MANLKKFLKNPQKSQPSSVGGITDSWTRASSQKSLVGFGVILKIFEILNNAIWQLGKNGKNAFFLVGQLRNSGGERIFRIVLSIRSSKNPNQGPAPLFLT